MTFPRVLQYRCGPDRRLRRKREPLLGRLAWHSLYGGGLPSGIGPLFGTGDVAEAVPVVGASLIPFVVPWSDMPYSADLAGETFPAGTLAVCTGFLAALQSTFSGNPATNSIGGCAFPNRKQIWMYAAYGIPAAATATIAFRKRLTGNPTPLATLATLNVDGANGSVQVLAVDRFDGFSGTGLFIDVVATWSGGGPPTLQKIFTHPLHNGAFTQVPDTLPAGYTARNGNEQMLQPILGGPGGRYLDRPGRARYDSYATPANWGHSIDVTNARYVDGAFYYFRGTGNSAENTTGTGIIFNPDQHIVPPFPLPPFNIDIPPPADSLVTGAGWRNARFHAQLTNPALGTGTNSFHVTITRSDTGALVLDGLYDSGTLIAQVNLVLGSILPSGDGLITLTMHVDDQPFPYLLSGAIFTLTLSPRVDVPLPYTVVGPDNLLAPGGYRPATLTAVASNPSPAVILAPGLTSYTPSIVAPLAFIPNASGWYKVVQSSNPLPNVGEYEFMTSSPDFTQTANRGFAGRRFWCRPAASALATIQAFSPSFASISSGGTLLTTTQGNWWAFGTIAFPAAGTYEITVVPSTLRQIHRGIVLEWSLTDTHVVTTDGRVIFESQALAGGTYTGTLITPPSGDVTKCWIVGTGATGAWAGKDGMIATWDSVLSIWHFTTPEAGTYLTSATSWVWFDGAVWRGPTDPVIRKRITVAAASTVYLSLGAWAERGSGTAQATVAWVAV